MIHWPDPYAIAVAPMLAKLPPFLLQRVPSALANVAVRYPVRVENSPDTDAATARPGMLPGVLIDLASVATIVVRGFGANTSPATSAMTHAPAPAPVPAPAAWV